MMSRWQDIRFLPSCFPEFTAVKLEENLVAEKDGVPKREYRRYIEFTAWMAAWAKYSLAAALLEQMSYADTKKHRTLMIEVACSAPAEGRQPLLAVMYDDELRLCFLALNRYHMFSTSLREASLGGHE